MVKILLKDAKYGNYGFGLMGDIEIIE